MARQLEVRAIFEGIDEHGYVRAHFEPSVQLTRGLFECAVCGAKQADYALPGSDQTITCRPCESCGGDEFYFRQLFGTINGGSEINLVSIYNRDVLPKVLAARKGLVAAAPPSASEEGG